MFLEQIGFDASRVVYESESRNTWENIREVVAMAEPGQGETWLLVTSAIHMPRAVGICRQQGFEVVPFPVDYISLGRYTFNFQSGFAVNLIEVSAAAREWMGLAAYHLMGRTSDWFPGRRP
jgi:uncharacterized SAM-binding protein YcdF (DUF218 family)